MLSASSVKIDRGHAPWINSKRNTSPGYFTGDAAGTAERSKYSEGRLPCQTVVTEKLKKLWKLPQALANGWTRPHQGAPATTHGNNYIGSSPPFKPPEEGNFSTAPSPMHETAFRSPLRLRHRAFRDRQTHRIDFHESANCPPRNVPCGVGSSRLGPPLSRPRLLPLSSFLTGRRSDEPAGCRRKANGPRVMPWNSTAQSDRWFLPLFLIRVDKRALTTTALGASLAPPSDP